MRLYLILIVAMLLTAGSAGAKSKPKTHKFFPAGHDSVLQENIAAGNLPRYYTQAEVDEAVYAGTLVALYDNNFYIVSPKLPINRRYALPETVIFVNQLSLDFYHTFRQPLTVDSAIRPAETQAKLRRVNKSAAPAFGDRASSHERGCTVDFSKRLSKQEHQWLVIRLLYYRAIGRVLVIEERRCFHVFVKP